ncbi:MAG: subclass B3 metallo-beta-lactamase [Chitinophagaceae bacterium]
MKKSLPVITFFSVCLLFTSIKVFSQQVQEPAGGNPEWAKPYAPFRIAGNLYYVGTYDLASYLITTSQGHILINTGLAASKESIKTSIEKLGFKYRDIKILLTTQAHYDHLGAMAAIQKETGAVFMANRPDSSVVADGGFSDYALGGKTTFAPIPVSNYLKNNDSILLGNTVLIMLHHPGHTRGSCSYLLTTSKDEKGKSYRALIANMPTIVTEQKLTEVATYPSIASDLAYTLAAMKNISFDIWVASHAGQFNLHKKHKPGARYNPSVFADRKGYDEYLKELQQNYDRQMAQ